MYIHFYDIIHLRTKHRIYVKHKMVKWHNFEPEFDLDEFIEEKLARHNISYEEAVQCFENPFVVKRNKSYSDRYKLIGHTDSGRALLIIFQLKLGDIVRIITGWDRR